MFARDSSLNGCCDRCGFEYKLSELKYEIYDKKRTGFRICPTCLDTDHPQLRVGDKTYSDPYPAKDPRPGDDDYGLSFPFGFDPITPYVVQCSFGLISFEVS